MKTLAFLLLVGALSISEAKTRKYDDFSEISLKETPARNQTTEGKSIKLPLYRSKSYKDHIKDQLFNKHASVGCKYCINLFNQTLIIFFTIASAHPRTDASKDFKVDTDRSLSYFTKVYVGSLEAEIRVAFDTMSTVSLINSSNCQGCTEGATGFEYQRSYTIRKVNDEKAEVKIGDEIAKGVLVYDDLKTEKGSADTIKEFPFLLVNNWTQSVFENVDGVIGLSKSYFTVDGNNSGPALLNSLF